MHSTWDALATVSVWGNTGRQIVGSLLIFMALMIAQWLVVDVLSRMVKKIAVRTKTSADDTMVAIVESIRTPFYVILAFYVASQFLVLPDPVRKGLGVFFLIAFAIQGISITERVVVYLVTRVWMRRAENADDIVSPLRIVLRLVLGILAILLVLSNIGINVTSLIAGLGIGGVAVGFALQEVLSDLFNSFSLYVDKPFRPGDFIVVRNYMGTVKRITFNSTRIQALGGEEIVVPNKDMANEWVQNYKHLRTRRVPFTFDVPYGTPLASLREIPAIVQKVVEAQEKARFDRAHLKTLGASGLLFEVVFYVESDDYLTYMNILQEINLLLIQEFGKRGIGMAYPTQTIHLADASVPAQPQKPKKRR